MVATRLVSKGIAMRFNGLRTVTMRARLLADFNFERKQSVIIEREFFGKFKAHLQILPHQSTGSQKSDS